MKQLTEVPEAIMINVPTAFFIDKGRHHPCDEPTSDAHGAQEYLYKCGLLWFTTFYEDMGTEGNEEHSFYHFISGVPTQAKHLTNIYICFGGKVQYKAFIVEFIKKSNCADRGFVGYPIRNWVSQDKTKSKNIYWGRQSPFNLVMLAMAKELGENCTYKYQEGTEYQEQKFD